MIKLSDFKKIDLEVQEAVKEVFDYAKKNEKDKNDYYLFLCNGTYKKVHQNVKGYSPYILDNKSDINDDTDRIKSMIQYLKEHYSFSESESNDTRESLTKELQIYSHIWESKLFLKHLYQLANINSGNEYDWDVIIPNRDRKNKFFNPKIQRPFSNLGLKIASIIDENFNPQIRNAFAHSDYSFSRDNKRIELNNYNEKQTGSIQSIDIDNWTQKFCYTLLLNYYILKYIEDEKQIINGQNIEVNWRNKKKEKTKVEIIYEDKYFNFKKHETPSTNFCIETAANKKDAFISHLYNESRHKKHKKRKPIKISRKTGKSIIKKRRIKKRNRRKNK
jgi:hypothetical protein